MEIHRFEKLWLVASLVLIVGFIATVAYGAVGPGIKMIDDSGGTTQVDAIADGDYGQASNFKEPGVYRVGEDRYAVYVVARQFLFEPGSQTTIRLPADSTVTFYVTSSDVVHGFQLVGTNLNTMVIPGQVSEVTVEFDESGTYGLVCHEYCGSGHHTMAGTVNVTAPGAYNESWLAGGG